MRARVAMFLLCLVVGVAYAQSAPQAEETVDSNDPSTTTVSTSTTTTTTTTTTSGVIPVRAPAWIHLVRITALAGPITFLLLAWLIGTFVHYRLVRSEQAQFPAVRGTRTPQTIPMIISTALFLVPLALFLFFEFRARKEISLGIGGVIDEWQPVTSRAWTALAVCLVFAVLPWLFARRADTVG